MFEKLFNQKHVSFPAFKIQVHFKFQIEREGRKRNTAGARLCIHHILGGS